MKARVEIMPKKTVLDPQGRAVCDALHHLGLASAAAVRVGKMVEIELAEDGGADRESLEKKLHALCADLLSNPVIEDYRLSLAP